MTTPDLAPLGSQQASQHPRASKGELQMQAVETPHERNLGFRHRARQIVDAATAEVDKLSVEELRLLAAGKLDIASYRKDEEDASSRSRLN
jgi:hypothetical protein